MLAPIDDRLALDHVWPADHLDEALGNRADLFDVGGARHDDAELVAAEAGRLGVLTQCLGDATGDGLEQKVSGGLAHRFVDGLEVVEADAERRSEATVVSMAESSSAA